MQISGNKTVFSIFVLEALLLTLVATPGTLIAYPAHLRRPAVAGSSSPNNSESLATTSVTDGDSTAVTEKDVPGSGRLVRRITVVLDKLEGLGALFVFTNLLSSTPSKTQDARAEKVPPTSTISINPLRLVELTERLSGVLLASDAAAEHLRADPLTLLYRTFVNVADRGGRQGGLRVKEGEFAVTQSDNFADTVKERASRDDSDLIVVPWTLNQDNQEQESVVASYREPRDCKFHRQPAER